MESVAIWAGPHGQAVAGGAASRCLAHSLPQGEQLCVPGDLAALTEKGAQLSGLSTQVGIDAVGDVRVLHALRREVHG